MTATPVDPRMALDAASSQDLVQRKLSIDAMRKSVSGGPDKEAKLRESCEGFESLFLQKMWEQMRKNVKKEGYLHSKDEEAYQSMFDTELAKKMASAGGIGLGQMLYEQLSQQLANTSKTTGTGRMGALPIDPATAQATAKPEPQPVAGTKPPSDLYSEVEADAGSETVDPVASALAEMADTRDPHTDPANMTFPMYAMESGTPLNPVAAHLKETVGRMPEDNPVPPQAAHANAPHALRSPASADDRRDLTPLPERVSAPGRVKPSQARSMNRRVRRKSMEPRDEPQAQAARAATSAGNPTVSAAESVSWPVPGTVTRQYGWAFNERGNREWSTGMRFAAAEGTPVVAPLDGTVVFVGERKDTGMTVELEHPGGLRSSYGNASTDLPVGETVAAGTQFASVVAVDAEDSGAPGRAQGGLSFIIRRGELPVNPQKALAEASANAGERT